MKSLLRAARIGRVLLRYRLDTLLDDTAAGHWLRFMRPFVPRVAADIARHPRGARLRMALQELGPMFVKFGQILSTRRDVLPHDVADELALLQDRVAAFDGEKARQMVERELGQPIADVFAHFDATPLASASIAQVHAARLPVSNGQPAREVVVKVLRPDVHRQIASDIALLKSLAALVERTHPQADKLRPRDIVAEIEHTLAAELDLQREGANASVLRRLWADSDDLSVPEPIWSHTTTRVLTLERVHGIPSDDIAALEAAGIDRKRLAAKSVEMFYTQVFRDNFFHADAHAGNLWVDPTRRDSPRFIALDFGIMGQLSAQDQYYLAENFMAMFQKDYRRIAELHVQAGWMPAHVRLDELEAAVRAVCEPYFTRPLAEISLGEVLGKLFRTARQYQLTLQPQLILLQKTLLTIEGLGRLLDPELDIWAVAHPVLKDILRKRYSLRRVLGECRKRLPELITHTPDMPQLIHAWLSQQVAGQHQMQLQSADLAEVVRILRTTQRRVVASVIGVGLWVAAVLLYSLDAGGPRFAGIPAASWIAGLGGLGAMLVAWSGPRSFRNHHM